MSYFDSPKNKAIWERELRELRKEKREREANGYRPEMRERETAQNQNPFRKKITFLELEASVAPKKNTEVRSRQNVRATEQIKSLKNPRAERSL